MDDSRHQMQEPAMTVDDWLRDTEVEPPCGPNLEYDYAFMALMSVAAGKPEQQFGQTIIAAQGPDWNAVLDQSSGLLRRTKDLRVTLLLTRALTRLSGLRGFGRGIELTRRLLEAHWDDVHPRLTIDGEADPVIRANALSGLADDSGLLRDLRAATLIFAPMGSIPVRSAEGVLKRDPVAASGLTEAQLAQASKVALGDGQAALLAVPAALDHCRAIQVLTVERMGSVDAPDLQATRTLLETLARLVVPARGDGEAKTEGDAVIELARAGDAAALGALRTRQDAVRALDAVCEFLTRSEPSNPAPLLIRRAQRLIGSGFMDIMRDMAPESIAQIEAIAGIKSAAGHGEG